MSPGLSADQVDDLHHALFLRFKSAQAPSLDKDPILKARYDALPHLQAGALAWVVIHAYIHALTNSEYLRLFAQVRSIIETHPYPFLIDSLDPDIDLTSNDY